MLRNEYMVIEVSEQIVRLQQTLLPFEFLVSKSEFEPAIVASIAIGDTFSGVDRGSRNPFDLVLERKAHERDSEAKSIEQAEQADFKFVPDSCAGTAQEAEIYLRNVSDDEFAVISGETQKTANGWLVPIKLISELYSRQMNDTVGQRKLKRRLDIRLGGSRAGIAASKADRD
jgi:hypothetical protein